MEFMLLFLGRRDAPEAGPFAEMGEFVQKLAREGKLRRGGPLRLEAGAARVRVENGKPRVTDGPFAETKEVLGGFWVVDVASREEALEIARRVPHLRYGPVEVHALEFRNAYPDAERGPAWLFEFCAEPRIEDPDRAKLKEMLEFSEALAAQQKLVETAPLAADPPPARLETRGGKVVVLDGPFAEAKEVIGGYALLRAADRAEAVEIAKRYPHAKWGPVVVEEMMFFDRT